ncbi:MAZ protein, partial [Tricholaema leucomelas]|nr:MAZ protein [Tricholaema leucomelas]
AGGLAQPLPALPGKKAKAKAPHICPLCSKEFKNGYNLRRHQAVHGGGHHQHHQQQPLGGAPGAAGAKLGLQGAGDGQ